MGTAASSPLARRSPSLPAQPTTDRRGCGSVAALPFIVLRCIGQGFFTGAMVLLSLLLAILPTMALLLVGSYLLETMLARMRALFAGPVTLRWRGAQCIASQGGREVRVAVARPIGLELVATAPSGEEGPAVVKLALFDARRQAFQLASPNLGGGFAAQPRSRRGLRLVTPNPGGGFAV